jgi:hypothetical protein
MHHKLFAWVAAVCLLGAGAANATTINFDNVSGGPNIFSPTDVSTLYAGLGVTFSDPAGPAGAVVNSTGPQVATPTLPNIFFANQHQSSDAGDLQINFTNGTPNVSLDYFLSTDFYLSFFAYDQGGGLIIQGNLPPTSSYGQLEHLGLSSVNPIYQLVLTSHPNGNSAYFGNFSIDDLKFNGAAVPEPANWVMMLIGFGGLGAVMRSRRRAAAATAAESLRAFAEA